MPIGLGTRLTEARQGPLLSESAATKSVTKIAARFGFTTRKCSKSEERLQTRQHELHSHGRDNEPHEAGDYGLSAAPET
jgi:hypothetical protein